MRPHKTNRDQVLDALRAGPKSLRELAEIVPLPSAHLESLALEDGIEFECRSTLEPAPDGGCRSSVKRFVLVRDEWRGSEPRGPAPKLLDRLAGRAA